MGEIEFESKCIGCLILGDRMGAVYSNWHDVDSSSAYVIISTFPHHIPCMI